jgi:hypothetical protein
MSGFDRKSIRIIVVGAGDICPAVLYGFGVLAGTTLLSGRSKVF